MWCRALVSALLFDAWADACDAFADLALKTNAMIATPSAPNAIPDATHSPAPIRPA